MKNKLLLVMIMLIVFPLATAEEKDSDLDGIPNSEDRYPFDYDNDKMPDSWEKKYDLNHEVDDANEDLDEDGISNLDEYKQGTDPSSEEIEEEKEIKEVELLAPKKDSSFLWWGGIILAGIVIFTSFIMFQPEQTQNTQNQTRNNFTNPYPPQQMHPNFTAPRMNPYPQQRAVHPQFPPQAPPHQQNIQPNVQQHQEPHQHEEQPNEEPAPPDEETPQETDHFEKLSKHIEEHKRSKDHFQRLSNLR